MDGWHAAGPLEAHRREYRSRGKRRAPAQFDRAGGVTPPTRRERSMTDGRQLANLARLPFFYGWVIVAAAFVTMAIGVNARTAFSLLLPPLLDEFGWDRGLAAGAVSFGFLVSAVMSPLVGALMDRRGPRVVIESGVLLLAAGLLSATLIEKPWQLYLTLGALVGGGANCISYTAQSPCVLLGDGPSRYWCTGSGQPASPARPQGGRPAPGRQGLTCYGRLGGSSSVSFSIWRSGRQRRSRTTFGLPVGN